MRFTEEQRVEEGLETGRLEMPKRVDDEDLAEAYAVIERLRDKPPLANIPDYCQHGCTREGWLVNDRPDGTIVAEGCPIHKPEWQYLNDRTDGKQRPALSPEEVKEREKGSWYD